MEEGIGYFEDVKKVESEEKRKRGRPKKMKAEETDEIEKILQEQEIEKVNDSLKILLQNLIAYPYNILSGITGYDGFKLSEEEKEINYQLILLCYPYLLEKIEQYSLIIFIIFNLSLLGVKFVMFKKYKEEIKKEEIKKEEEKGGEK